MPRRGFTLIEVLLAMGIMSVLVGVSIPMYRRYQTRNDLHLATEQVVQGINRARLLSQAGREDSSWGFSVGSGVLFKGTYWISRDTAFDESYPIPSTVSRIGLQEVSFSRLEGMPSATGTITLMALTGEQLSVEIELNEEGIPLNTSDRITVCHQPGESACATKLIPDNAWPGHQSHGDHLGPCALDECAE